MKKYFSKSITIILAVMMILLTAVPFVSAATLLDDTEKVSVTVNCDKVGYTFELFEVAALKTKTDSPYETYYEPLFDEISELFLVSLHRHGQKLRRSALVYL